MIELVKFIYSLRYQENIVCLNEANLLVKQPRHTVSNNTDRYNEINRDYHNSENPWCLPEPTLGAFTPVDEKHK